MFDFYIMPFSILGSNSIFGEHHSLVDCARNAMLHGIPMEELTADPNAPASDIWMCNEFLDEFAHKYY
jgi:hypothetical protein